MQSDHELILESFFDVAAHCACGRWSYVFTGARDIREVRREFERHARPARQSRNQTGRKLSCEFRPGKNGSVLWDFELT